MQDFAVIIIWIGFLLFLVIRGRKLKTQSESKLAIFEHPSTFKKQPIEMVNKNPRKEETSTLFTIQEAETEEDNE